MNFYYHDDVNLRARNLSSRIQVQSGFDWYGYFGADVVAGEVFDIAVDGYSEGAGFVTLSIDQQPKLTNPANDTFDFRIGVQGNSYSANATTTSAVQFEPGEPLHAGVSSSGTVWWTWTAPGGGYLTLTATATTTTSTTVSASEIEPVIAVYTGPRVSELTPVASVTDVNADRSSTLRVSVVKGRTYQIAVANGPSTPSGAFTFTLNYASGAPVIATQPSSRSISAGADTTFTVRVASTTIKPITYRWQRLSGKTWVNVVNGTNYSGATTSTLRILNATGAMSGSQYRCIVKNSAGTVISNKVKLTVVSPKKAKKKAKLLGR